MLAMSGTEEALQAGKLTEANWQQTKHYFMHKQIRWFVTLLKIYPRTHMLIGTGASICSTAVQTYIRNSIYWVLPFWYRRIPSRHAKRGAVASHLALDGLYYLCMGWKKFAVRPVGISERGLTFVASSICSHTSICLRKCLDSYC